MSSGPFGMSCVSVAALAMRPSYRRAGNVYWPSGKSALNCSSGNSVNGDSLLSENSSVRP